MMRVSVVYETSKVKCETSKVKCETCGHEWVAVIETDEIQWSKKHAEVKLLDRIECPNCQQLSLIQRLDNGTITTNPPS